MKLKDLVQTSNTWYRSSVGASLLLGLSFLLVAVLHFLKKEQVSEVDFTAFMVFMIFAAGVLLSVLLYSLFMLSEVTRSMVMSHRVLSLLVEDSGLKFAKLRFLDINGFPVLPVLQAHGRYDLIERYIEELKRARQDLSSKLSDLTNDLGARANYQSIYDQIEKLPTWKLYSTRKEDAVHRGGVEVVETLLLQRATA